MAHGSHSSIVKARKARARAHEVSGASPTPPTASAAKPGPSPAAAQVETLPDLTTQPIDPATAPTTPQRLSSPFETFFHASEDDGDLFAPTPSRKDSDFARQRRAHLRKYVWAVTSVCALIVVAGFARMVLDGLSRQAGLPGYTTASLSAN